MKSFDSVRLSVSTLSILVALGSPVFAEYKVVDLGTLSGDTISSADSVNNYGQIAGQSHPSYRACLFDSTGGGANTNLVPSGSWRSWATSINDSGQIVGNVNWIACLFDSSGGGHNTSLGTLSGYVFSFAQSINNSGQIVGKVWNQNVDERACLFDPTGGGANKYLGGLADCPYSHAYSNNDSGQIVGAAWNSPGQITYARACLFDRTGGGANIDLGTVSGCPLSGACGINNNGQIVGWVQDSSGNQHACLFDSTGGGDNRDLGPLISGGWSVAYAINDSGQIIGSAGDNLTGYRAGCLFDSTGYGNNIDLNNLMEPSSGWKLLAAGSINNNGWIVGYGKNSAGAQHGLLLVPMNQPPVANAGNDQTIEATGPDGAQVTLDGSGSTDPDGDPLTYEWTWDGQSASGVAPVVTLPLGLTTITLTVSDGQSSDTDTVDVLVQDTTPPEILIGAPTQYGLYQVEELALAFSATDATCEPSVVATLYAIGWEEDVPVGFEPDAGVYTLVVGAWDDTGNSAHSDPIFFVVYDPEGGFVTGGGWIWSAVGAYAPDPTLEGKANFGFVSKYQKGASVPTGNTEFVFQAADLNFHSTSYQWLVVAGARAVFKGVGTVNGAGDYGFMLSAVDAAQTPSTDVDLFRIKIWDKGNADMVVYDNQMGDDDNADLTTAISGGNIMVHTK